MPESGWDCRLCLWRLPTNPQNQKQRLWSQLRSLFQSQSQLQNLQLSASGKQRAAGSGQQVTKQVEELDTSLPAHEAQQVPAECPRAATPSKQLPGKVGGRFAPAEPLLPGQ